MPTKKRRIPTTHPKKTPLFSEYTTSRLRVFLSPSKTTCGHGKWNMISYTVQCGCDRGDEILHRRCLSCLRYACDHLRGIVGPLPTDGIELKIICNDCNQRVQYRIKTKHRVVKCFKKIATYFYYLYCTFLLIMFTVAFIGGMSCGLNHWYPESFYCNEWMRDDVFVKHSNTIASISVIGFYLVLYRDHILIDRLKAVFVVDHPLNRPYNINHPHLD